MQPKLKEILRDLAEKYNLSYEDAVHQYNLYYEEYVLKEIYEGEWDLLNLKKLGNITLNYGYAKKVIIQKYRDTENYLAVRTKRILQKQCEYREKYNKGKKWKRLRR